MKRIVTMQDLSGVGKCSLTAAIPVISAMGIETSVLPTAVLSAHTMFHDVVFHDLTAAIPSFMNHWQKEGITFDAVYTAYLGSAAQLELAEELIKRFPAKDFILVDPCMADHGKLYSGFTDDFPARMRDLCGMADYICPNLTEAALLTGETYIAENYPEEYIRTLLKKLAALGAGTAMITGVSFDPDKLGVCTYDSRTNTFSSYFTQKQPQNFPGTGDLWASCLCGAIANGMSTAGAIRLACDFVNEAIRRTLADPGHHSYATNFEQALPFLIDRMRKALSEK